MDKEEFLQRADKVGISREDALRWWEERVERTWPLSPPVLNQGREPASVGYAMVSWLRSSQ